MERRLTRPGRPPPKGLVKEKSICFSLSTRTMNEGMFTICFPTLHHTSSHFYETIDRPNVTLEDQNASMMNGFCKTLFKNQCLQTPFQKILWCECQDIIQFVLIFSEKSITIHASHESPSFENTLWIVYVKHEQGSSCISNFGQSDLDAPQFAFVFESIFSKELQFGIQSFFFERTTRPLGYLRS